MKANINSILTASILTFEKCADQILSLRERSDTALVPVRKAMGAPEDKKEAEAFFLKLPAKKKKELLAQIKLAFVGENPTEDAVKKSQSRVARFCKALGLVLRVRSQEDELDAFLRKAAELGCEREMDVAAFMEKAKAAFSKAKEEEQAE